MSAGAALPSCEELYIEHRQKIYCYLLRLLKNRELAEDLTQETFVRVWKALPRIQQRLRMSAWLYRIATNLAYDQLRRRRVITWQSLDSGYERLEDPARQEEQICEADVVDAALKQLPPNYRRALLLWNQGYPPAAIAHELGKAEGGSKMYLKRAKELFKRYYVAALEPDLQVVGMGRRETKRKEKGSIWK